MPLGFPDVVSHSPFSPDTFRWRMGLRSTRVENWLQPDDQRAGDLAEKAALQRQHPEATFVALPDREAAAHEVLVLVDDDLRNRGLTPGPRRSHPLDTAGSAVQEDLCLMERLDETWVMTAASVCFPTRWDVPSKLGRSIEEIHSPVPGYIEHLGGRVERFLDRMTPGAIAERLNWSLVGEASRRLEPGVRQAPLRMPLDPGRDLFIRVERQTLRRLTLHEAVVFGIRIHVWPLVEVASALPAEQFAAALEQLPIDVASYKNLDGLRSEVAMWLRSSRG